ncbi:hypothetical protein VAE308_1050065 [Vibrio aestuarianus]|uniref:Uncharacterized protein n=1 Tax=Vibrio aestuarianus TaxID=28171 RepID=A0ABM9FP66_9VIBR|nr:hypothetical protein VAE308_1050065 [Vibrio aestuarianus]CAH8222938.1 hypothetical protein VAE063_940065 [Vibrio aestuarianus]
MPILISILDINKVGSIYRANELDIKCFNLSLNLVFQILDYICMKNG